MHKFFAVITALLLAIAVTAVPVFASPALPDPPEADPTPNIPFTVQTHVYSAQSGGMGGNSYWLPVRVPQSTLLFTSEPVVDNFIDESTYFGTSSIKVTSTVYGDASVLGDYGYEDWTLPSRPLQIWHISDMTWGDPAEGTSGLPLNRYPGRIAFDDFALRYWISTADAPYYFGIYGGGSYTVTGSVGYYRNVTQTDGSVTVSSVRQALSFTWDASATPNLFDALRGYFSRASGNICFVKDLVVEGLSGNQLFAYSFDSASPTAEETLFDAYAQFNGLWNKPPQPAPVDPSLGSFLANTVNGFMGAQIFELGGVSITIGTIFGGMLSILVLIVVLKWLGV